MSVLLDRDKKPSGESLNDMIARIQSDSETLRRSAEVYNVNDALNRTFGYTVGSTTDACSTAASLSGLGSTPYIGYSNFEKVTQMLDVIYNEVTTVIPYSDGVDIIARALDGFQCPVEECKRCRYYLPGSVDGCDRTRALAAHLLESGTVKIIPPKHIDKGKDT